MSVKVGYEEALRRYRPKQYRGSVSIIASQHDDGDPKSGWASIVRGKITVHEVQGDHQSYIRDFVQEAATRLKVCLEE